MGQNTAAIAANEAHYGEMSAQDAAAMYGYAASSAAAPKVTPFAAPQETANSAGLAGQAAAVAHAAGSSTGAGTQAALSRLTSAMPSALQGLASPTQATRAATASAAQALPVQVTLPSFGLTDLLDLLGLDALAAAGIALASALTAGAWAAASQASDQILRLEDQTLRLERHLHHEHHEILGILGHPRPDGLGAGSGPVSGNMGRAVSVGGLSAPPSWAVAAPEIRRVAYALPATGVGAAPAVFASSLGTAFSQMAMAGMAGSMAGSALGGTVSPGRPQRVGATTLQRATAPQSPPANAVTGIAADHLRELALAVLHDGGILTDEEFTEKRRLVSP